MHSRRGLEVKTLAFPFSLCYIMRESKGIVAWKARWSSRLLESEANVKTNGEEKR